MSNVTGFKSTDIDSYSKVDPATVTKFGYKRQGQDTNAMTGLYELTTTTTEAGTTDQIAVMSGVVGTVREGDVLEYSGMRSEIVAITGSSFTLGRKISTLVPSLAVTIYRPTYLLTDSSGAVVNGTSPSSLVIETVTGTISALNGEVVVDNPRFCLVELWGTANQIISFYKRLDTPTGTAEDIAYGTKSSTVGALTAGTGALSFNATNEEAWAQFSIVAAQRFIVRASGYTSGTLNVRITNLNWPVEAGTLGLLSTIHADITNVQFLDDVAPWFGNLAGGYDEDLFSPALLRLRQSDPVGSESGLIVRNIPSGVQAVYPIPSGTSVAAVARGKLAGSSLTTSYQTVLSMGGAARILHLYNGTEVPIIISFDAGTTDNWELDPYESASIDYVASGLTLSSSTIQAKLVSGSAATNGGSVRAMVTR